MTQLTTQTQQVLNTLIEQKTITSWEAIQKFRCTRLSAVIYNLRQDGHDIRTHRKTNEKNGKSFAEYRLFSTQLLRPVDEVSIDD